MKGFPYMTELTDEQLVRMAASGDSVAADRLCARYIPLVGLRASAFFDASGVNGRDDLGQEGFIGLLEAMRRYDENVGASFKTFAVLCIDRRMTSVIRASMRKKKVPESALVRFDDDGVSEIIAGEGDNPESRVIALDEYESLCNRIKSVSSEFEGKVLALFLRGMSYQMIAAELSSTEKAVDNALQRVRKKLAGQI